MEGQQNNNQALWNFDLAELILIFGIKEDFLLNLRKWDLENAYWSVRNLRMELDSKLSRRKTNKIDILKLDTQQEEPGAKSEKTEVDEQLQELENSREEYNRKRSPTIDDKGKYYLRLELFYMNLCHLMKVHGLYFREGEDNRLAVLRR